MDGLTAGALGLAAAASLSLRGLFGSGAQLGVTAPTFVGDGSAPAIEATLTAVLMMAILSRGDRHPGGR